MKPGSIPYTRLCEPQLSLTGKARNGHLQTGLWFTTEPGLRWPCLSGCLQPGDRKDGCGTDLRLIQFLFSVCDFIADDGPNVLDDHGVLLDVSSSVQAQPLQGNDGVSECVSVSDTASPRATTPHSLVQRSRQEPRRRRPLNPGGLYGRLSGTGSWRHYPADASSSPRILRASLQSRRVNWPATPSVSSLSARGHAEAHALCREPAPGPHLVPPPLLKGPDVIIHVTEYKQGEL